MGFLTHFPIFAYAASFPVQDKMCLAMLATGQTRMKITCGQAGYRKDIQVGQIYQSG